MSPSSAIPVEWAAGPSSSQAGNPSYSIHNFASTEALQNQSHSNQPQTPDPAEEVSTLTEEATPIVRPAPASGHATPRRLDSAPQPQAAEQRPNTVFELGSKRTASIAVVGLVATVILGIIGIVYTVIYGNESRSLAEWEAEKDYWYYCQSQRKKGNHMPHECAQIVNKTLPPPPFHDPNFFLRTVVLIKRYIEKNVWKGCSYYKNNRLLSSAVFALVTGGFYGSYSGQYQYAYPVADSCNNTSKDLLSVLFLIRAIVIAPREEDYDLLLAIPVTIFFLISVQTIARVRYESLNDETGRTVASQLEYLLTLILVLRVICGLLLTCEKSGRTVRLITLDIFASLILAGFHYQRISGRTRGLVYLSRILSVIYGILFFAHLWCIGSDIWSQQWGAAMADIDFLLSTTLHVCYYYRFCFPFVINSTPGARE